MASPSLQEKRGVVRIDVERLESRAAAKRQHLRDFLPFALASGVEIAGDTLAIVAALFSAYAIYHLLGLERQVHYPLSGFLTAGVGFALLTVLLLERTGTYCAWNSLLTIRETERILRASLQASLIALTFSYFARFLIPAWLLGLAIILAPVFLMIEKLVARGFVNAMRSRGYGTQRVLIYGAGSTGKRLFSALSRSPKLGLQPVIFVDDDSSLAGSVVFERSYQRKRSASVINGPLIADVLRKLRVDLVLIGIPSISREKFMEISREATTAGCSVSFVPCHHDSSSSWVEYADIDGLLVAAIPKSPGASLYDVVKRCFDLVASLVLLVLLSPLLLLLAALIRLTSPGPALFIQERVGQNGNMFRLYKFRTMYIDTPQYEYSPLEDTDPRITPLGRYLRRSSLDELPQLLNVMRGEMSLVGPRPEMPFIVRRYLASQRHRLDVRPGLTGLWQLSADRAYLIHENIEYDLYYIRHRNFFMDLAILVHTIFVAARGI